MHFFESLYFGLVLRLVFLYFCGFLCLMSFIRSFSICSLNLFVLANLPSICLSMTGSLNIPPAPLLSCRWGIAHLMGGHFFKLPWNCVFTIRGRRSAADLFLLMFQSAFSCFFAFKFSAFQTVPFAEVF